MECGQDWAEFRAAAHHKLDLVQGLVQQQQGGRVRRDYGGHDDHHDHFDGEVVIKCRNSYTGGNTVTNWLVRKCLSWAGLAGLLK